MGLTPIQLSTLKTLDAVGQVPALAAARLAFAGRTDFPSAVLLVPWGRIADCFIELSSQGFYNLHSICSSLTHDEVVNFHHGSLELAVWRVRYKQD